MGWLPKSLALGYVDEQKKPVCLISTSRLAAPRYRRPNLVGSQFAVARPDQAQFGDITYIAIGEGWLFLAMVIGLFIRQLVGWSLRADIISGIVIDALRMA